MSAGNRKRQSGLRELKFTFLSTMDTDGRDSKTSCYCWLQPTSYIRGAWDACSMFLVAVDLYMIPLQFLDPDETSVTLAILWLTRLFWTVDIPLTFLTGSIKPDGTCEMRCGPISRMYLTSWFPLDLFIVLTDWLVDTIWGDNMGYLRLGKATRGVRVLRLFRLVRLVRVVKLVRQASERIRSEKIAIMVDVLVIAFAFMGMAHIIACSWFAVGNRDTQDETWVKAHTLEERPLYLQYFMSLHWSLSQFTGGMDEIRPYNFLERLFACIAFILAYVAAAIFLGRLTSSMTQMYIISSHQAKQFQQLRRYLAQNAISDALTMRICRNAQHAFQQHQSFTPESNVTLLDIISEPLRIDLHYESYSPVFTVHPFFSEYAKRCPEVMRKICHGATLMAPAACGDTIFDAAEVPPRPQMYFICAGELQYVSLSGTVTKVSHGEWLSEAALWTPWMHMGALTATCECRLVKLFAREFAHIVDQFVSEEFDPSAYAAEFVRCLNTSQGEISDLAMPELVQSSRGSAVRASLEGLAEEPTPYPSGAGEGFYSSDVEDEPKASSKNEASISSKTDSPGASAGDGGVFV
eukprot:TRINITY_DN27814_c0_g1_i2.p1 TRINITY_DN27814_c0_g1~~TRINITY_DN27814_c0_g1_i2.p1  ORF type:complete len:579 (-),score=114.96 TRINITY_DN27814_c0_g1_i2:30-1766(-)